jgi:hypothetical protein
LTHTTTDLKNSLTAIKIMKTYSKLTGTQETPPKNETRLVECTDPNQGEFVLLLKRNVNVPFPHNSDLDGTVIYRSAGCEFPLGYYCNTWVSKMFQPLPLGKSVKLFNQ